MLWREGRWVDEPYHEGGGKGLGCITLVGESLGHLGAVRWGSLLGVGQGPYIGQLWRGRTLPQEDPVWPSPLLSPWE